MRTLTALCRKSIGLENRAESPWFGPVSWLKTVERAACRSLAVPWYSCGFHMWVMARVCSPPSALFVPHPICSLSQPSLSPAWIFLTVICNYFPKCSESWFWLWIFIHLFPYTLFFSFVMQFQKTKVTSVYAPETLCGWHSRIIKCQITVCTDNLCGGMR